jgi:hypothetical protein
MTQRITEVFEGNTSGKKATTKNKQLLTVFHTQILLSFIDLIVFVCTISNSNLRELKFLIITTTKTSNNIKS